MKKIVLLAAVALFAATVIGCGPAPTTGSKSTTLVTETKSTVK